MGIDRMRPLPNKFDCHSVILVLFRHISDLMSEINPSPTQSDIYIIGISYFSSIFKLGGATGSLIALIKMRRNPCIIATKNLEKKYFRKI